MHDTCSSWHPLFVSGAAYASLGDLLHQHGLEYRNTDGWTTGSVAADGRTTLLHRNPERTVAEFEHSEDRAAYLAALAFFGENMGSIGELMSSELRLPTLVRSSSGLARTSGRHGVEQLLRAVATSGRGYTCRECRGSEVDHLLAPWLLHAGLSPAMRPAG